MAITVEEKPALYFTATGVTAGNEYIWPVPQGNTFVIQAIPTVAGTATPYTSSDGVNIPSAFTELLPIVSDPYTEAFQESPFVGGQRWVGVKVDSGTWTVSLTLSDKSF